MKVSTFCQRIWTLNSSFFRNWKPVWWHFCAQRSETSCKSIWTEFKSCISSQMPQDAVPNSLLEYEYICSTFAWYIPSWDRGCCCPIICISLICIEPIHWVIVLTVICTTSFSVWWISVNNIEDSSSTKLFPRCYIQPGFFWISR